MRSVLLLLPLIAACTLPKVYPPQPDASHASPVMAASDASAMASQPMDAAPAHEPDASPKREVKTDAGTKHTSDAGKRAPDAAKSMPTSDSDAGPDIPLLDNIHYPRWPMPDALPEAQTKPAYETRGDTVIDLVTHLEWQRTTPTAFDGCTARYADADPEGAICTWPEAEAYCKSYALLVKQPNWRLPTKIELETLVNETTKYPAMDTDNFRSPRPYPYWTGTPYPGAENSQYYVEFSVGTTSFAPRTAKAAVRCVR